MGGKTVIRIGHRLGVWALLLALVTGAGMLHAQDGTGETKERVGEAGRVKWTPELTINVDFVQKSIHVVMHFIALRSGLNISVEGDIDKNLTVMYVDVKPKEAIKTICESNELLYIENGVFIFIKKRAEGSRANVVPSASKVAGRFDVRFEDKELIQAVSEVANVCGVPTVSVPAIPGEKQRSSGGAVPGAGPDLTQSGLEEGEKVVETIKTRKITLFMINAEPDAILHRIKELGQMDLKVNPEKTDYAFSYPPVVGEEGKDPVGPGPDEIKLETAEWTIPGVKMSEISAQVRNILTIRGRLVFDETTGFIMVIEDQRRMPDVRRFLDNVRDNSLAQIEASKIPQDPLIVKSYNTLRDVSDTRFQTGLTSILTKSGKVVVNTDANTIIVYDVKSNFSAIDQFMQDVDTAPNQVFIQSKLIEVSLDNYMGYGLQMFTDQFIPTLEDGTFTASSRDSGASTVQGLFGQPSGFDPFFATFTNARVDFRFELLATDGKVRTLSTPSAMVSSGKKALIKVGQEVPYLEIDTSSGASTVTVAFKEINIQLEVSPKVLADGLIRMDVKLAVREQIGELAINGNNTPVISNRETETNVFIRDGETLAIGGLIRERERTQDSGIPFLKDIPILGLLFKSENVRTEKTDLLFFLRPQIVTADVPGRRGGNQNETPAGGYRLAREIRPGAYSKEDAKKLGWVDSEYWTTDKKSPKPAHFDEAKRPKDAKGVNPNQ